MKYAISIFCGIAFIVLTAKATTIGNAEVVCGNCGTKNEITVLGSTNQLTPPDLDNRPGEMQRSTLCYEVQHCKKCHYCNDILSNKPESEDAKKVIAKPMPKQTIKDQFVRVAEIAQAESQGSKEEYKRVNYCYKSALYYQKAAWCCDDKGLKDEAVLYRRKAAACIEEILSVVKNPLVELNQSLFIILIDIYRRCGEFKKAEKYAQALVQFRTTEQRVAELQLKLCKEKKTDCHTYAELPDPPNYPTIILR